MTEEMLRVLGKKLFNKLWSERVAWRSIQFVWLSYLYHMTTYGIKKLKWIRKSEKHNKLHFLVVTVTPGTQILLFSVSLFYSPWLDSCWFLNVPCIVCTILIYFFLRAKAFTSLHSLLGSWAFLRARVLVKIPFSNLLFLSNTRWCYRALVGQSTAEELRR